MAVISRRDFAATIVAGVPLAAAMRTARAAGRVTVGVTTSSFRELARVTGKDNIGDVIRSLGTVGARHIELALANVEPAPPSVAPFLGGTPAYPRFVVLTPEEIAATNASARAALRAWRLRTGPVFFEGVRARLAAAGLTVPACTVAFDDSFTDDEIDATFREVRALGVATVASPLTMAMAVRLAPFAERHAVSVAIHNQEHGNAGGAIGTADLARALSSSPRFTVKLDVGNITASNGDALAEFDRYRARVSHVVVRDRLRNGGASQPLGEGDTPIADVVKFVARSASPVPVFFEYDYIGLRPATEEVALSLRFLDRAAQ
jgi:sugar phosphate isomerase/epimerase